MLSLYKPCDHESHIACTANFPGITSVTTIVSLLVLLLLIFAPIIQFNYICYAGFIVCGICICIACRSMDIHVEMYISSLFNDCDTLHKTNNLSVYAYNDAVVTINIKKTLDLVILSIFITITSMLKRLLAKNVIASIARTLERLIKLATKSRKFRRFVFSKIRPSVPKSSTLHNYIVSAIAGHSISLINRKFLSHINRVQNFKCNPNTCSQLLSV